MFSKRILGKLSITFLLLFVVMIIGIGCNKQITLEDVTDKNNNTQNDNQNNQDNQDNQNNQDTNNNTDADRDSQNTGSNDGIKFLNINLVGGEPPLQKKEGIFYFTKTQHPPSVRNSFRYDTHNGWLIQLDNPAYYGMKIKVLEIKRNGGIYDITVRLQSGGDRDKPGFGFFEVGIFDMPTSGQFRIYNDAGQKLWPKF